MSKKQIAEQIKKTEESLAELRRQLEKPEEISEFKIGDVWGDRLTAIIVLGTFNEKYYVAGHDRYGENYLNPWGDNNGETISEKEMLIYLNRKIAQGWKYAGNIGEKVDAAMKELVGEK